MSDSIETLITRAIELGLQTAIASTRVAEKRDGGKEPVVEQLAFERLSRAYQESLRKIEAADPDHFALHRNQVTAMVREAIRVNPEQGR